MAQQAAATQHDDSSELDCCKKETPKAETVISACSCPCDNEASFVLTGGVSGETIPFIFTEQLSVSLAETSYPIRSYPLFSRHTEPPDPPPEQIHS